MAKQTANNGSSQAASTKSVTFSRQAAQRIAKAVRTVEGGNRNQPGIRFDHPMPSSGVTFQVATFTGAWSLNTSKTVEFYNITSTPNTASVTNLLLEVPALSTSTNSPTVCFIAKARGTWQLLNVQHAEHEALTSVTLQPTRLEFGRKQFVAVATTIATTGITITECDNEAASAEQLNWFFG